MSELEQRLTQLGRELDWPETPELASAVRQRLAVAGARPARRRRPIVFRRSLAIALASLLVLAGGVFAAVPGVRDAVLEFFGLQGATVERRRSIPDCAGAAPAPARAAHHARARPRRARLHAARAGRRRPARRRLREHARAGRRAVADLRPGRRDAEARAARAWAFSSASSEATSLPSTSARSRARPRASSVCAWTADRAIWIEGAPHLFFYRPPDSDFAESELRLAPNVLLLERGNLLVRLEGAFGRERAIELARSLRPAG